MKIHRLLSTPKVARALALTGVIAFTGLPYAHASTDIQVWHSLSPHNAAVFDKLVKQFNSSQSDVKVAVKAFDSNTAVVPALDEGLRSKKLPNLVQLDDNRDPEVIAQRRYILPMYSLLAKYPVKNVKWFIAADAGFMHDDKGRMLALPYMVEVPVMFYNVSAFKKAGIVPAQPMRSWPGLQGQLVTLANTVTRHCPLVTNEPVSINLENLAAVNNQFFTTDENGRKVPRVAKATKTKAKGKSSSAGGPAFVFDLVYVRHLSLMITWVRSELMLKPEAEGNAVKRFANNECSVLLSDSSNLGAFRDNNKLDFGVVGLPYYPEVTSKPGNPFVDGAGLWATSGHSAAEDKATAEFIAWLAQTKNAATWYQNTGYLPLTQQAFNSTDASYYKNLGDWRDLVAVYEREPASTARSFRIANYPQIRAMFHQTLDRALNGQEPAVPALSSASAQADYLMHAGPKK